MDFALMFGAAMLLFGSVSITGVLSYFQQISAVVAPDAPIADPALWRRMAVVVPPILSFSVFTILYWWLPNTKLTFSDVWPTAIAGTIAFEISKAGFVFYLQNFDTASNVYGAVNAVIVLMAWVYVSAIILLVGAQLTSRYVFYKAAMAHKRRNESLSLNLERIRALDDLPGFAIATRPRASTAYASYAGQGCGWSLGSDWPSEGRRCPAIAAILLRWVPDRRNVMPTPNDVGWPVTPTLSR